LKQGIEITSTHRNGSAPDFMYVGFEIQNEQIGWGSDSG
jgi:hypothetical protein